MMTQIQEIYFEIRQTENKLAEYVLSKITKYAKV